MDPAPRDFDGLPHDPVLGVPVPFACGTPDHPPAAWGGGTPSAATLDHRRVTQCALSRVCSVCGATLDRPLTLLGTVEELDRLAFHLPPMHRRCADRLLAAVGRLSEPMLRQPSAVPAWVVVTTGGFEYVRPTRDQDDLRATFRPNSVLTTRTVAGPDGWVSPGSASASG